MRLLRYGAPGAEKPGILDQAGRIRDLSAVISDWEPAVLCGSNIIERLRLLDLNALPIVSGQPRLGQCLNLVGKLLCAGYNSRKHAEQMKDSAAGNEMVAFLKPTSAICGPNDPILYSRITRKLDWEAELSVVVGKKAKYIAKEETADYILGYTLHNDISDRFWQFETIDNQYTKGKGMDSFAPLGPYLVTKDEVSNPGGLQIKLWVNGELRQDFNSSDYIYNAEAALAYLSQFFTLYPGDIISLGSGPGNAQSWGEDKFLKPGDRVVFEIEGLGRQEKSVVEE